MNSLEKINSLGWTIKKLEETNIEIIDGDRGKNYPKKSEFKSNGYCPFLNNKNLLGDKISLEEAEFITRERDSLLRKGRIQFDDIIITTRGSVGNVGLFHRGLGYDFARINSGMVILRNFDDDIITEYLYYLLKSPILKTQYLSMTSGSAQPQLPIRDLKKVKLVLPPRSIQEKIVTIISSLERKIDLNNKINITLEKMAFQLFKNWFKTERTLKSKLSDLITLNPRISLKKGTNVSFVDMKALPTNSCSVQYEDVQYKEFSSGTKFENGDVLFARITPCLQNGKTAIVDFLKEGEIGGGSTEFLVLRPLESSCTQYIYCLTRDEDFRRHAEQSMVGTSGRQRVQNQSILDYEVKLPEPEVMNKFNQLTVKWFELIKTNNIANYYLRETRDFLLPRLILGEIDFLEATEKVKEVILNEKPEPSL
ncbi:restriction endonuclease subunit S [Virgibacillus pantothenticus]|uniref:restriction endonuclease subunit S n=1 Tax=Virgibacillus pantothenticus TaxID=1473 RepID=UPI00067DF6BC|nr:restriction endonuclease subunit S [Virgibacillus pantothenticus]MED3739105.1 restriction endonuclease subunit S [Virgibacillus pantothenticus]QTY17021.1 restriction endonuclease subunit S [Virgibacillus pantothenticus]SIT12846.1 type I restriction enzyme, S subunit [Virgibacillus pantothenticus]